ncbi:MAG: CDP-alcohol phosphatidyltransferase family protein [Treponema sp.]|nr:CDP-alcohol phosphatidyltransferase family protein [Treponema sp.]
MKIRPVKVWKSRIRFGKKQPRIEAPPRKKRRLKYIAVLPSIITLMNGACGFIAIVFASRSPELRWNLFFIRGSNISYYTLAGYMLIFAMIADMLDGRVARLTRTTSSFGGQLDSLSDTISFGAAPAFLMMRVVELHLEHLRFDDFRFSVLMNRGIFFCAIFYAMCAVVRLARFNVENEEDEAAHMNFVGLPSPAAAGVVVSLVIFYQQLLPRITGRIPELYFNLDLVMVIALPLITFLTGILMVSRFRYPHLANQLLRGKKSLSSLLLIFAIGILILWNFQLAIIIGFCGFALFGVLRWVFVKLFRKRPAL